MPLAGRANLPRSLGPYTLLRRIAVGGMAEVYVAKARGVGGFEKLVAIKLIHPQFSEDDHFVQMLVDEAKLSVLLNHANIGQTFDLGHLPNTGTYFIVMEYIDGADGYKLLKRAAAKRATIPIDVCVYLMSEVCKGLDYAHRKRDVAGAPLNIVHRDISPQNVLISLAGEVKIVDFGIAKAAMRSGQTEVGVIKGKYYYMSPEQAWADPVDNRSDIFSTGIVLYEFLTGKMLYEEENLPRLLDAVRKANITPPSRLRPDIPPELDEIIMRSLAKHPAARYPSAHEFGEALTRFLYKRQPNFTSARLADLMASLFPKEHPPSKAVPISTESLEAMKLSEFRPDVRKSVIFDLDDYEDQTRTEAPLPKFRPISEETEDDMTFVQPRQDWDEDETTARFGIRKAAVVEEDAWSDATSVDDQGEILQRMREALERQVAEKNRTKTTPKPPPPAAPVPLPQLRPAKVSGLADEAFEDATTSPDVAAKPIFSGGIPDLSRGAWDDASDGGARRDVFAPPSETLDLSPPPKRRWIAPAIVAVVVLVAMVAVAVVWGGSEPAVPRLDVVSRPSGAQVLLDGEAIGQTPLTGHGPLILEQNYRLEVRAEGYEPWETEFQPVAGTLQQVAVLRASPSISPGER
ncbi:MAG: serine/threonine-protein kinase [Myxococcota bacterium]